MQTAPMLACGHTALAKDGNGAWVCPICVGIHPGARDIVATPSVEGRTASCAQCGKKRPSETDLPFFQHRPSEKHDFYYCGCHGWD